MITCTSINNHLERGYLGNQLFVLASMIGYAKKYNIEVLLPEWSPTSYFKNVFGSLINCDDIEIYNEPNFHYNEIPFKEKLNIQGYFQSYKYFENAREEVLKALQLKDELKWNILNSRNNHLNETWDDILGYNQTCSIHGRFGDYNNFPNHFTNLSQTNYYNEAIEKMNKIDYFIVFSNDISYSKTLFKGKKFLFCESKQEAQQGNSSAIRDLFLQSQCDHNITANSSFSWWAAYLNTHTNKRIVSPGGSKYNWFGPALYNTNNTKDLIPESWIKL